MVSACVTLPLAYLSYLLSSRKDFDSALVLTIIEVAGTVLFMIVLVCFKRFLSRLLAFSEVNNHIDIFIIAGSISAALSIITLLIPDLKTAIESVMLVLIIIQGVIQIHMGYTLLKLPYNPGGLLKPFCYLTIATGIMTVSIILLPFALVASALSDLMLASMFMGAAKQLSVKV